MWLNLIIGLVFSAISYLLTPKPTPPTAATLDDFKIPLVKEGTEIGKVYGTVWISNPHVHWYGDLKTEAIRSSSGKK